MSPTSKLVALALVLVLAAVGCGNDNSDALGDLTDVRADPDVSGSVVITGSSTVQPLSALVAEAFAAQNDDVAISVDGPGTGDGFERFCEGQADVTGASRTITEEELARCEAAGIDVVELEVGLDGVAVVVADSNPVECLTFADLYALVGPESRGIGSWPAAEAIARSLGSTTELPDTDLLLVGPGEESGTYDTFVELVLDPLAEERVASGDLDHDEVGSARADYSSTADDNALVSIVAGAPGGLGWVGLAYAEEASGVRAVPIAEEPDGPCVAPSEETVRDGTYAISRSLYLYVSAVAAEREEVAAVVDFYLATLDDFVPQVDYVALDDAGPTTTRWDDRVVGSASHP